MSGQTHRPAASLTTKFYVVQTDTKVIERCLLMTTDPGDLCLDPTCGSGTTAYVAEQWGRRWITCDTSRVALALARTRLMAAKYPYYLLADSPDGAKKEMEIGGSGSFGETTESRHCDDDGGHPQGVRLQARPARHAQIHRQQPGHPRRDDAGGDRRGHRPSRRDRNPLRPALRGQQARARRRAVHGGEPVAASGALHRR